jgi:hypothetical protein
MLLLRYDNGNFLCKVLQAYHVSVISQFNSVIVVTSLRNLKPTVCLYKLNVSPFPHQN